MIPTNAKFVRALAATMLVAGTAVCGSAGAQALSDELQIVLTGGTTHTYYAYDAAPGSFEAILAYANVTGGMDYSANMDAAFMNANGTFNTAGATAWFSATILNGSLRETALTEPGSGTLSDVMLSFMATVNGSKVNAIALISDPTLVADIAAINAALHITPTTSPETGSLQNVTALVYPSKPPFTVNVLSAVPEAGSWILLICGLATIALVYRRRSR